MFIVRDHNDMYWRIGDRGYSFHIEEARHFTKAEIIERLEANGLMGKFIDIYKQITSV